MFAYALAELSRAANLGTWVSSPVKSVVLGQKQGAGIGKTEVK
jgi:hypothetical protein